MVNQSNSDLNLKKNNGRLEYEVGCFDDLVKAHPVFAFTFDDDKFSDKVYSDFHNYLEQINAVKIKFFAAKGTILQVWISEHDLNKYFSLRNKGKITEP